LMVIVTSPDFKLTPVEKIEGKRPNKRGKGDGSKRKPMNFELISAEKPEQRKRYKSVSSSEQRIAVGSADIKDIVRAREALGLLLFIGLGYVACSRKEINTSI
jgi:hypothetical protein